MNIRDDFAELCRLVPVDPSIAPDDPSASGVDRKWILLRAPWQHPLDDEHTYPLPATFPPRSSIDSWVKSSFQKWFYKDTMATQYKQYAVAPHTLDIITFAITILPRLQPLLLLLLLLLVSLGLRGLLLRLRLLLLLPLLQIDYYCYYYYYASNDLVITCIARFQDAFETHGFSSHSGKHICQMRGAMRVMLCCNTYASFRV